MSRRRPPAILRLALAAAVAWAAATASPAGAATPPELRCQQVLAKGARDHAKRFHTIRAKCENRRIDGNACDAARDEQHVLAAEAAFRAVVTKACTADHLAALGFPGPCTEDTGPPFTADEAVACMIATHNDRVEQLIDIEYPGPPSPVNAETSHCADHIGRSRQLVERILRARQGCLYQQALGKIPMTVDCHASATTDDRTDQALAKAASRSQFNLIEGCDLVVYEDLGFPGGCSDPNGGAFSAADLVECIWATHDTLAGEMLRIEHAQTP